MKSQAAILESITDHARHLFFTLKSGADPRTVLRALGL